MEVKVEKLTGGGAACNDCTATVYTMATTNNNELAWDASQGLLSVNSLSPPRKHTVSPLLKENKYMGRGIKSSPNSSLTINAYETNFNSEYS